MLTRWRDRPPVPIPSALRRRAKHWAELRYWRKRADTLENNQHYAYFFTEHFKIERGFYAGKRILDIGCGPRGSLEWANDAAECVGVDPLANDYLKLGASKHRMRYVQSGAEELPFDDGHFDVVSTFNSLDHVDDVDAALREIHRVTAPGGTLLLIVEVAHEPTWTEPHALEPEFLHHLEGWDIRSERLTAFSQAGIYSSLRDSAPYESGPGLLSARLERASAG
jgi:ubiquinone/menaquinone biosynthesis C-methylase UbiE